MQHPRGVARYRLRLAREEDRGEVTEPEPCGACHVLLIIQRAVAGTALCRRTVDHGAQSCGRRPRSPCITELDARCCATGDVKGDPTAPDPAHTVRT